MPIRQRIVLFFAVFFFLPTFAYSQSNCDCGDKVIKKDGGSDCKCNPELTKKFGTRLDADADYVEEPDEKAMMILCGIRPKPAGKPIVKKDGVRQVDPTWDDTTTLTDGSYFKGTHPKAFGQSDLNRAYMDPVCESFMQQEIVNLGGNKKNRIKDRCANQRDQIGYAAALLQISGEGSGGGSFSALGNLYSVKEKDDSVCDSSESLACSYLKLQEEKESNTLQKQAIRDVIQTCRAAGIVITASMSRNQYESNFESGLIASGNGCYPSGGITVINKKSNTEIAVDGFTKLATVLGPAAVQWDIARLQQKNSALQKTYNYKLGFPGAEVSGAGLAYGGGVGGGGYGGGYGGIGGYGGDIYHGGYGTGYGGACPTAACYGNGGTIVGSGGYCGGTYGTCPGAMAPGGYYGAGGIGGGGGACGVPPYASWYGGCGAGGVGGYPGAVGGLGYPGGVGGLGGLGGTYGGLGGGYPYGGNNGYGSFGGPGAGLPGLPGNLGSGYGGLGAYPYGGVAGGAANPFGYGGQYGGPAYAGADQFNAQAVAAQAALLQAQAAQQARVAASSAAAAKLYQDTLDGTKKAEEKSQQAWLSYLMAQQGYGTNAGVNAIPSAVPYNTYNSYGTGAAAYPGYATGGAYYPPYQSNTGSNLNFNLGVRVNQ